MTQAKKISISLPAEVADQARAVAEREVGGNLSLFVTSLLLREIRARESLDAVASWEAEHGPLSDDELEAARRWLA